MPAKGKRNAKQSTNSESVSKDDSLFGLSPVQMNQLAILAQLDNNSTVEQYVAKLVKKHIADRLYLLSR